MNSPPMELDIWKGDWGLASVDLDCLRLVVSNIWIHVKMYGNVVMFD